MKKLLLSSVALLGFTAGAMAADLPSRAAPASIMTPVPVFTWTGFYVGVNAGYGWSTDDNTVFVPGIGYVGGGSDGGFVGGAQIGYDYQMGMFVLGAEADLQYVDLGRGNDTYGYLYGYGYNNSSNDWLGTVRARAGIAFDRALVYATGGFAFGDSNSGWTVGAGVEYAFTNNLTAKVEGLYVSLDGNRGYYGYDSGGNNEFGLIRVGVNYKFNTY